MRGLPHRLEKRSMGQAFSMRRFLAALFLTAMIPYVVTLAWTGRLDSEDVAWDVGAFRAAGRYRESESCRTRRGIRKNAGAGENTRFRTGGLAFQRRPGIQGFAEECLPSLLAGQIPKDYGEETKKAQAVLLRTGLCLLADESGRIQENQLSEKGIEFMDRGELEQLWGETEFASSYEAMLEAVQATKGEVAAYSGAFEDGLIYPFYCRAATGKTRTLGEGVSLSSPGGESRGFEGGRLSYNFNDKSRANWRSAFRRCRTPRLYPARSFWKRFRLWSGTRRDMYCRSRREQRHTAGRDPGGAAVSVRLLRIFGV